jgi:hypothetical protein
MVRYSHFNALSGAADDSLALVTTIVDLVSTLSVLNLATKIGRAATTTAHRLKCVVAAVDQLALYIFLDEEGAPIDVELDIIAERVAADIFGKRDAVGGPDAVIG